MTCSKDKNKMSPLLLLIHHQEQIKIRIEEVLHRERSHQSGTVRAKLRYPQAMLAAPIAIGRAEEVGVIARVGIPRATRIY